MLETLEEKAAYRKVTYRILPVLFLCYLMNYLDRVNVGFAKLQMLSDLEFSETIYGFGAGLFFISYFIFEIPSNLIMHRYGARFLISTIMAAWGVISICMLYVTTPMSFYVMRFLLGLAESGFFPGVILYLTYWYPNERRARVVAGFLTAIAVSGTIGGPLSGWIMSYFQHSHGLSSWQWLFLLEGIPSVLLALMIPFLLSNNIAHAKWLSPEEKALLISRLEKSNSHIKEHHSLTAVFRDPRVWIMMGLYFVILTPLYSISFFLPTFIKEAGVEGFLNIGLFTAIPYTTAIVAMTVISMSSDKKRERRWHLILPMLIGAIGFLTTMSVEDNIPLAIACFSVATAGVLTSVAVFWSLPTAFLTGVSSAAGIAIIASFGNLGGFFGPFFIGYLKDLTHSTDIPICMLATCLLIGAFTTYFVPKQLVNR